MAIAEMIRINVITTHISIIEKPRWPLAQRSFNWEFSCDCFTLTPLSRPKVRGPTLESGCRCALDRPCDGHHNSIYFCGLDGVTRSVKRDLEFFGVEMLPLRCCATWLFALAILLAETVVNPGS